jgi:hypothetical protein
MLREWFDRQVDKYYRSRALHYSHRKRVPKFHPPFPNSLYRSLILQIKVQRLKIAPFEDRTPVPTGSRMFFRHDIDYAGCVSGAGALLDVDREEGVPAAVFLRMDGEDYHPEEAIKMVEAYKGDNITFGLHTSCYTHENYLAALERERQIFARTLGFEARTFTVHGLGKLHLHRRLAFTAYATAHLYELGFDYSDCTADLRPYHRVFQDCDRAPANGKRAIYSDMTKLPPLLRHGHNYLVLTHPCYWTDTTHYNALANQG